MNTVGLYSNLKTVARSYAGKHKKDFEEVLTRLVSSIATSLRKDCLAASNALLLERFLNMYVYGPSGRPNYAVFNCILPSDDDDASPRGFCILGRTVVEEVCKHLRACMQHEKEDVALTAAKAALRKLLPLRPLESDEYFEGHYIGFVWAEEKLFMGHFVSSEDFDRLGDYWPILERAGIVKVHESSQQRMQEVAAMSSSEEESVPCE